MPLIDKFCLGHFTGYLSGAIVTLPQLLFVTVLLATRWHFPACSRLRGGRLDYSTTLTCGVTFLPPFFINKNIDISDSSRRKVYKGKITIAQEELVHSAACVHKPIL